MWHALSIEPMDAAAVMLATAAIYWFFVILIRVLGQRALVRSSSPDLATAVALGSIIGRAALGYTPTLAAGIIALVTLFVMQALAGQLQRRARSYRLVNNVPLLLMAAGKPVEDNLRRSHMVEEELWPQLRQAGIRNRAEIACVILEPTGEISVLRMGEPLDQVLVQGVRGAEYLPADMFLPNQD